MGTGDYQTPEEMAADFSLPIEAVDEAIVYCVRYPEVLEQDRLEEDALIRRHGWDKPPRVPHDFKPNDA